MRQCQILFTFFALNIFAAVVLNTFRGFFARCLRFRFPLIVVCALFFLASSLLRILLSRVEIIDCFVLRWIYDEMIYRGFLIIHRISCSCLFKHATNVCGCLRLHELACTRQSTKTNVFAKTSRWCFKQTDLGPGKIRFIDIFTLDSLFSNYWLVFVDFFFFVFFDLYFDLVCRRR